MKKQKQQHPGAAQQQLSTKATLGYPSSGCFFGVDVWKMQYCRECRGTGPTLPALEDARSCATAPRSPHPPDPQGRDSPKEEEVSVALHDGVRVTGEVAEPGEVESGAGGHLQHAAPRLVAQQLDLSRIKESSRVVLRAGTGGGVPLPGQIIVSPVGIGVKSQHPRVNDDGSQLGSAPLAQRSPLGRQLAAPPGSRPGPQPQRQPQQQQRPRGRRHRGRLRAGGGASPAPLRDWHRDWGVGMGMGEKKGEGQSGDVIGEGVTEGEGMGSK